MRRAALPAAAAALSLAVSCTLSADGVPERAPPTRPSPLSVTDSSEPYPFTTPVPPRVPTPVDGTYTREVTAGFAGGPPVPCRRCPPYRIDAGRSTLELRSGRFRVSHEPTRFSSSGHFTVSGRRVVFFNDANCTDEKGVYAWSSHGASFVLAVIEDGCAFGLRARYLTALPWSNTAAGPHPVQYFNLTNREAIDQLKHLQRLARLALGRRDRALIPRTFTDDGPARREALAAIGRLRRLHLLDKTKVASLRVRVLRSAPTRVVLQQTRLVYPCLLTEAGTVVAPPASPVSQRVRWELALENITWLIHDEVVERSERLKTRRHGCP